MRPEKKAELMRNAKGKSSIEFLDNLEAAFLEADQNRTLEELEEDLAALGVDVEASRERTKRLLAKYGIYPEGRQMKYIMVDDCLKCQHSAGFPKLVHCGALCEHIDVPREKRYADEDHNMIEGKVLSDGETELPEQIPPPGWCPLPDLPEIQEQATPGDALRFQLWIVDAENSESVQVECWKCSEALGREGIHDFVEHCDYHVECAVALGYWPDSGDIPL